MKEDPEFNIYFVSLMEKKRCLYDFTCVEYTNRYAIDCAWESIGEEISEPVAECKARWKNLRACYTRYLKLLKYPAKARQRKKPYYLAQSLEFLKPFTKTRVSNNEESNKSRVENSDPEANRENPFMVYNEEECNIKEEPYSFVPTGFKLHRDDESNHDQSSNDEDNPIDVNPIEKNPFPNPTPTKTYEKVTVASIPNENKPSYEATMRAKKRTFLDSEDPDVLFLKSIIPDIKEMTVSQKRAFRIGVLNLVQNVLSEQSP